MALIGAQCLHTEDHWREEKERTDGRKHGHGHEGPGVVIGVPREPYQQGPEQEQHR